MKKEKIFTIIIASICFALWFMPLERIDYAYSFTPLLFFEAIQSKEIFTPIFLGELLIVILGIIAIALLIVHIFADKLLTKILSSVSSFAYVIMWLIQLFAKFPSRVPVYTYFDSGANILWLLLYFILLLAIIVLTALQYLQYLPPRRPTKAERLQAKIDELQQQVDELKKGE